MIHTQFGSFPTFEAARAAAVEASPRGEFIDCRDWRVTEDDAPDPLQHDLSEDHAIKLEKTFATFTDAAEFLMRASGGQGFDPSCLTHVGDIA